MTKNRLNDRSTRRAAWVALACLVFGHLYAKRATAAPRLTSSGIRCMPAANPTIDWTNLSHTVFGPANHTAGTRYLYCPTGVFQDAGYRMRLQPQRYVVRLLSHAEFVRDSR